MPATLEAVRPIALDEIEPRAERIPGHCDPHAAGQAGAGPRIPGHPAQAREPAADQRLQAARRGQRRGDALRGRARSAASGRSAPATPARASPTRRARPACPARSSRSRPRPTSKIERMRALGAKLVPVPYDVAWKALDERAYPGVEGTFIHPFDDHNFIAGHATHGARDPGGRAGRGRRHRRHRRRRPDHRRRQRDQGARRPRSRSGAPSRRRPRRPRSPSPWARRRSSPSGRRRSSTAPAARASSRACGSGCSPSSTARSSSPCEETRRAMRLMAEKARVIAEGAALCRWPPRSPARPARARSSAVVSGGNVDLLDLLRHPPGDSRADRPWPATTSPPTTPPPATPEAMAALVAANDGFASGYGTDAVSAPRRRPDPRPAGRRRRGALRGLRHRGQRHLAGGALPAVRGGAGPRARPRLHRRDRRARLLRPWPGPDRACPAPPARSTRPPSTGAARRSPDVSYRQPPRRAVADQRHRIRHASIPPPRSAP